MQKKQPKVEYKETAVFDVFPEFEYTRRQRAHIVLFHFDARHIVKAINYAANFDVPNKLCLIYIVGQPKPERIMKILESAGCSDRVCVLTAPISDEALDVYERFDAMRKQLIAVGLWNKANHSFTEVWCAQYRAALKASKQYPDDAMIAAILERYEHDKELAHQYLRLKKACKNTIFKKFTCYRVGHLPKPFTHDRLDSLILKTFPLGAEALQINDFAALSPAGLERGIAYARSGVIDKRLGFTVDDDTPLVRALRRFISKQLAETGYCNAADLGSMMRSPPFGLTPSGYAAACFVYALQKWANRTMLFQDPMGYMDSVFGHEEALLLYAFPPANNLRRTPRGDLRIMIESHAHKAVKQAIAAIFRVKITMPFSHMAQDLRERVSGVGRPPVADVDERLWRLLNIADSWYDVKLVTELANDIDGHIDELRTAYLRWVQLCACVPEQYRIYYSEAAAWCWSKTPHESTRTLTVKRVPVQLTHDDTVDLYITYPAYMEVLHEMPVV